jgi:hypothetical protein
MKNLARAGSVEKFEIIAPPGLSVTAAAQARKRDGEIKVAPHNGLPAGIHPATTMREFAAQERDGA